MVSLMNRVIGAAIIWLLLFDCLAALSQDLQDGTHQRIPAGFMSFRGAEWLERESRETEEQPEKVLEVMQLKPGDVVADIGCGSGYYARRLFRLVQPGGVVYCEDIQPEMLEIMAGIAVEEGVNGIQAVLGTPTDLQLPSGELDWVIMADVYHEMSNPKVMLSEIKKSLSTSGQVALLEYRGEDGTGDQIKSDHVMSVRQVMREWNEAGFYLKGLHEFLPTQHLFFFQAGSEGAEGSIQHLDLFKGLDDGMVEIGAVVLKDLTVELRIRRRLNETVVVTSPAATFFQTEESVTDLVSRRDAWVLLDTDDWVTWSFRVVSLQKDLVWPRGDRQLKVLPRSTFADVANLMDHIQEGTYTVVDSPTLYPPRAFEVEQAAVWMVAENINYASLMEGLSGSAFPEEYAIAFALVFCDLAGIDIQRLAVWERREEIFQPLRDQGLK